MKLKTYIPTEQELEEMEFKYDKYTKWWEYLLFNGTLIYEKKKWILYGECEEELKPINKQDIEILIRLLR